MQKGKAHTYSVVGGFNYCTPFYLQIMRAQMEQNHAAYGKCRDSLHVASSHADVTEVAPAGRGSFVLAQFHSAGAGITRIFPAGRRRILLYRRRTPRDFKSGFRSIRLESISPRCRSVWS